MGAQEQELGAMVSVELCLSNTCKSVSSVDVAQLELDRFLTLHLRSRKFPSIAAYIETVRVLAALSDRVAGRASPRLPRPTVPLLHTCITSPALLLYYH